MPEDPNTPPPTDPPTDPPPADPPPAAPPAKMLNLGGDPPAAGDPTWNWAEGVPGEGDRPDWVMDKYKTVEAQARAYGDAEKKLGAFTGAPETYELNLSKDLVDAGLGIDASNPAYAAISELCSGLQMNQGGFDKLLDAYVRQFDADRNTNVANEIEKLGSAGKAQISIVESYANAHMADEQLADLAAIGQTAAGIRMAHYFIGELAKVKDAGQPANPREDPKVAAAGVDDPKAELDKLVADDRYRDNEPGYRAMVDQRAKALYPE